MKVDEVTPEAFICCRRTERVSGDISTFNGLTGQSDRAIPISRVAGRRRGTQQKADPIGTPNNGRIWHSVPQRQRLFEMAQRLGRSDGGLGLASRLYRGR
jgi:hypothetical protein